MTIGRGCGLACAIDSGDRLRMVDFFMAVGMGPPLPEYVVMLKRRGKYPLIGGAVQVPPDPAAVRHQGDGRSADRDQVAPFPRCLVDGPGRRWPARPRCAQDSRSRRGSCLVQRPSG